MGRGALGLSALALCLGLVGCTTDGDGGADDGDGGLGGGGGEGGGGGGGGALRPGAAGTGTLAYLVVPEGTERVEVTDLDTAEVRYRSRDREQGNPQRLYLTPSGSHLVWAGGPIEDDVSSRFSCWHVDLNTGVETDCRLGTEYLAAYTLGVTGDGARVVHTALHLAEGRKAVVVAEGAQLTELAAAPPDSGVLSTFGGGVSPVGDVVYLLHYGENGGGNVDQVIWRYPLDGGVPAPVVSLPANITVSLDGLRIEVSEDGGRLLMSCVDADAMPNLARSSTCAVDAGTGALTVYTGLVSGRQSLDGRFITGGRFALSGEDPVPEGFDVFAWGETTPLRRVAASGNSPALSPDGARLAWRVVDSAPGLWHTPFTTPVAGGAFVQVSRSDDSAPGNPSISWSR